MMFERLLEIGYEAELNTEENPELMELAYLHCNEIPVIRDAVIQELRSLIISRNECNPIRSDDVFLLKFLRATKFIVPRAHKLLVRYCTFRETYPNLYQDVEIWQLSRVKDFCEGTFLDHPKVGRLVIFKLGAWDPNNIQVEDLLRASMLMLEIAARQPKLQVFGGTVILDLQGLTLKHVAALTPTVAHQIVNIMGLALPVRLRACHIINNSWILNTFLYLLKSFIPKRAWDIVHFHGPDLQSLHKHIAPEYLPSEYGGRCKYVSKFQEWLEKIRKYRDASFNADMQLLGYIVK